MTRLIVGKDTTNPFCFPCCGYYCDSGRNCPCPDCRAFWHPKEPDIDMENERRREYNEKHFDDEVKG